MMLQSAKTRVLGLILVIVFYSVDAQVPQTSELFKAIQQNDSLIFEVGFNQCNLTQLNSSLSADFEFYHDKEGIVKSREAFIKSLRDNLCSKGKNATHRLLDKGSVEVFPLYNNDVLYGAIQTGEHSFGNTAARFTNLWLLEQGVWKPARMISYDHKIKPSAKYEVKLVELSPEQLAMYVGKYVFSPEFTLAIILEDGKLYGDAQGQKVELKPYGDHNFLDQNQTIKLTFVVGPNGAISQLKMITPNGEMLANKVE
ncbi:MAG: DUF3471 domain-containing protein [Cyclobacteriaceae bacterium]|nr:DUF3471 domain-containing protein [Cyclobacteriaceae bacterium]